jgi:hypothetical protein
MPNVAEWIGAGAGAVTAASALAAVTYGGKQYRLHEKARRDALRPHVVVDLVPSPSAYGFVDLVISNIGASTATNVRLRFDPELRTVLGERTQRRLADTPLITSGIPSLPPGRELRTAFELLRGRENRPDLPGQYRVVASYEGMFGPFSTEHILDIELFAEIVHVKGQDSHALASVLKAIDKDLDLIATALSQLRADQG